MRPGTRRWVVALVLLVGLQLAAKAWGEAAEVSPPWDFTFDRPERARVFWAALLFFLVGSGLCFVRVLPPPAFAERWSLASVAASFAGIALFATSVLGAGGVVHGLNELLPRAPEERVTGVVAGFLHATDGTELTVVRMRQGGTLEVPLPPALTKRLPPESPITLELHHGVLFSWGRVERLGLPVGPPRP